MQKLFDLVYISLLELSPGPFNTIIEVGWLLGYQKVQDSFSRGKWLVSGQLSSFRQEVFGILEILKSRSSIASENAFKLVTGPL